MVGIVGGRVSKPCKGFLAGKGMDPLMDQADDNPGQEHGYHGMSEIMAPFDRTFTRNYM